MQDVNLSNGSASLEVKLHKVLFIFSFIYLFVSLYVHAIVRAYRVRVFKKNFDLIYTKLLLK